MSSRGTKVAVRNREMQISNLKYQLSATQSKAIMRASVIETYQMSQKAVRALATEYRLPLEATYDGYVADANGSLIPAEKLVAAINAMFTVVPEPAESAQ